MSPRLRTSALLIVLLLCAVPVSAQWKFGAELNVGGGSMPRGEGEDKGLGHGYVFGKLSIGHTASVFKWNTTVECQYEPKTTLTERNSAVLKGEESLDIKTVMRVSDQHPLSLRWRTEATVTPDTGHSHFAWLQYNYRNNPTTNGLAKIDWDTDIDGISLSPDMDVFDLDISDFKLDIEEQQLAEHVIETGMRSRRQLANPRLTLAGDFTANVSILNRNSDWTIMGYEDNQDEAPIPYEYIYRITSSSVDPSFSVAVHLMDSVLNGSTKLFLDPGIRILTGSNLNRNSGATNDGGEDEWRDSVRLRENFNFLELRAEPYLAGELRHKSIRLRLDYALQIYSNRLNDDTRKQKIDWDPPHPVGNSTFEWQIAPNHKLFLNNTLSVQYPSYLQICWYDRPGEYVNQLIRGNIDLLPTRTATFGTGYIFGKGGFGATVSASIGRKNDEIDRTYVKETIQGEEYKIFTWVNSADSWIGTTSAKLSWNSRRLTTGASVDYRQTMRRSRTTGEEKRSFDWNFKANASADLGKGWKIGTDIMFQSKVATFFTMFNEYCVLNASVQKRIENITLTLTGRDLLDSIMKTEYLSADETEYWQEIARNNRRLIILGIKWDF